MPEKGWYSLTVRKNTADKIRELAKNEDLTVDEYLNQLIEPKQTKKTPTTTLVKCKKCGGTFILKLETIKKVAKPTSADDEDEDVALSMGLVHALDENGKNLGHIGYF